MKSTASHRFSEIPKAEIQRSSFDRSFGYKTTFDEGLLIPFYVDEAYPGDTFNLKLTSLIRIATLLKPPMDNMYVDFHFFFVPMRLCWDNWARMHGEQDAPTSPTDYTVPQIVSPATTGWATGSIYDYMGLPVGVPDLSVSALPLRAYNRIYRDWYRNQNVISSPAWQLGDGPDSSSVYQLFRRHKRLDYFTSALPWPQKGDSVTISIGAMVPVESDGTPGFFHSAVSQTGSRLKVVPSTATGGTMPFVGGDGGNDTASENLIWGTAGDPSATGLRADLTAAQPVSINDWREAFQLQRLLERDARGGTRYPEIIRNHFGVTDPQFDVLQRPQFLGGGSCPLNVHAVPQASPTGTYANTPQGNLAAFGTVQAHGIGFTKSFTEHGLVMGIMSTRADVTYQNNVQKMWLRKTRFDHYYPALSHLGEQAILQKEIYPTGVALEDDKVFGYQERWSELRYRPSQITGKLRSNETGGTPLDMWHLAQDFGSAPTLSQQFVEEDAPVDRIIAVPAEPHFICDMYVKLICARPLPTYSVPGMVDHF